MNHFEILSILFYSSSTNTVLREQDILPLSCICTIKIYILSLIKPQCGFDDKFSLLLKKKMASLSKEQRVVYLNN